MKRYDPTRADSRTLGEKLVGLFAAASADDLIEANDMLAKIQGSKTDGRFAFRFPVEGAKQ